MALMPSYVNKKWAAVAISVAALLGVLAADGVLWWLTMQKLEQGEELQRALIQAEIDTGRLGRLRSEWEAAEKPARAISDWFLTRETLLGFLEALEVLAQEEGIDITFSETNCRQQQKRAQEKETPEGFCLTLTAEGNFQSVMRFFARLESFPLMLSVQDGALRASAKGIAASFLVRILQQ